jgi:hypothetical protein
MFGIFNLLDLGGVGVDAGLSYDVRLARRLADDEFEICQ